MIIRIFNTGTNAYISPNTARVVRVYNHRVPSGITVDVLTEAGSMIVALAASNPSETGAPTADGQAWVSDLTEAKLGRWQSVATSAGGSIELTNKSGETLTAGTVVVLDKSNDSAFTTTTNLNDRRVVGVLEEDIDNNAAGQVAVKGKVVTVKVQGNVSRGYWLTPSATVQRAAQYGTTRPSTGGIGIALTSYSGGGAGTVEVLVDVDLYSAYLAIANLGTAVNVSASASSISTSHTLAAGSNRIAFVWVVVQTATVSGVTYGGVAMTALGNVTNGTERLYMYYLLEASMPADGSKTVTATLSGSAACAMSIWTIKNASQAAPSTAVTNSSVSASSLTGNVTVNVDGSWAVAAVFVTAATSFTHNSGQQEVTDYYAATGGVGTMTTSYEECATTGTHTQGSTAGGTGRMNFIATVIEPA